MGGLSAEKLQGTPLTGCAFLVETVDFTDGTDDQSDADIHVFTSQVKTAKELSFL
jgi:hypothetical protein